jgi:hypothetical protein
LLHADHGVCGQQSLAERRRLPPEVLDRRPILCGSSGVALELGAVMRLGGINADEARPLAAAIGEAQHDRVAI